MSHNLVLGSGGNLPVSGQCSSWIRLPRILDLTSLGWMMSSTSRGSWKISIFQEFVTPAWFELPACSGPWTVWNVLFVLFFPQRNWTLTFLIQKRRGNKCLSSVVHGKDFIMEWKSFNVSLLDDFLTELCQSCQENSGVEIIISESCIWDWTGKLV